MPTSPDTRNIYERIEAARPNFKPVVRNAAGQVGTRHYNYADLDVVCDAVEAALLAEGVGIFPSVITECVVTKLIIVSPPAQQVQDVVASTIPLPADLTPQQVGSAITYFRRYGLVALLNLRTEPDDDGQRASNRVEPREVAPEAQAPEEPVVPAGWDSYEQAANAHIVMVDRINALQPDFKQQIVAFRTKNGWPLTVTLFNELDELVRVAEGLSA